MWLLGSRQALYGLLQVPALESEQTPVGWARQGHSLG